MFNNMPSIISKDNQVNASMGEKSVKGINLGHQYLSLKKPIKLFRLLVFFFFPGE